MISENYDITHNDRAHRVFGKFWAVACISLTNGESNADRENTGEINFAMIATIAINDNQPC